MSTATAVMPRQNGAADDPFEMTANTGGQGNYDVCPAGNYPGVLVALIDLGTHSQEIKEDDGAISHKDLRQVALVWELSGEHNSSGEPYVLAGRYTNSFNEKAKLRELVEKWLGRKFGDQEGINLRGLLGQGCLVNVTNGVTAKKKEYANIGGISPVVRGMTVPRPFHEPFAYSLASGEDPPSHSWLPYLYGSPIPAYIRQSKEWLARTKAKAGAEDDCPY